MVCVDTELGVVIVLAAVPSRRLKRIVSMTALNEREPPGPQFAPAAGPVDAFHPIRTSFYTCQVQFARYPVSNCARLVGLPEIIQHHLISTQVACVCVCANEPKAKCGRPSRRLSPSIVQLQRPSCAPALALNCCCPGLALPDTLVPGGAPGSCGWMLRAPEAERLGVFAYFLIASLSNWRAGPTVCVCLQLISS